MNINIFVMKYYCIKFINIFSIFFESLKSKSTQMLKPQKRKLGSFLQRYSYKFRAQRVAMYALLDLSYTATFEKPGLAIIGRKEVYRVRL